MKRYRVLNIDFDSRASILSQEIQDTWEHSVKDAHRKNKERVIEGLLAEFGRANGEEKVRNYLELGSKPFSIVAFHNKFMEQVRQSFVLSSYYPALTGACALGERVLNHLILRLRDSFKASPEYKKVYRKDTFDNWDVPINALEAWGVLLPGVVMNYRRLKELRNKAIHFDPATDENDRPLALEAIHTLTKIVAEQFSGFGNQPWFIPNTQGTSFLKKEVEEQPFIKHIYIPNCALVGPYHTLEFVPEVDRIRVVVLDNHAYQDKEITDEEFAGLFNNRGAQARAV